MLKSDTVFPGHSDTSVTISIRGKLPLNFQDCIQGIVAKKSAYKIVHASYTVPACCDFLVLSGDLQDVQQAMHVYALRYKRPAAILWVLYSGATVEIDKMSPAEVPDMYACANTPITQFVLMIKQLIKLVDFDRQSSGKFPIQADEALSDKKRQFLLLTNHELRTPATIISGALDVLNRQKHRLPEHLQKMLSCAINGSERLNTLLQDISFLTQDQEASGHHSGAMRKLSLLVLMERVRQQYAGALEARKIKLSIEITEKDKVKGCPEQLFTLFSHLVSNAIKNTPDGKTIYIKSQACDKGICLQIIDSGKGIAINSEQDLFEPFYRGGNLRHHHSSNVAAGGGGLGLGLSICKQIVQQHRGTISIKSNADGIGATATILLPQPGDSNSYLNQIFTKN